MPKQQKPPKKKKQPQGRQQPPANLAMAKVNRSGRAVFDPTNMSIPPVLITQLGVFPIRGTVRYEASQVVGYGYFIMVTSIPGRGTNAVFGTYNPVGTTVLPSSAYQVFTMPLLTLTGHSGGPTASRCTKAGVRITNSTPALYQGGRVYISNLNQRLKFAMDPANMTGTDWAALMNTVRGLPEPMTVPETWKSFGENIRKDRSIYSRVVDEVKYQDYSFHNGPSPDGFDFFDHVGTWSTAAEEPRPMSTVLISWNSSTTATNLQDLTFNVDAQYLTRWPIDTVPGQHGKDVPGAPHGEVNGTR